jgi:inner membrane transporter RhtA
VSQDSAAPRGLERVPAWSLTVGAMLAAQSGAALSVGLFPVVGTAGAAWLRLTFGAVMFVVLVRPRLSSWTLRELRTPMLLGVVSGIMLLAFLAAIDRLPLGTAVAIDFLGPLAVAVARSHSRRALLWPVLALAGVIALSQPWAGGINPVGVAFAVLSAISWGTYIVLTQNVGDRFTGVDGLAISMPVAAITAAIVGIPQSWGHLTGTVVLQSFGLALLMPMLVFGLEMLALKRLTAASFGTLMALEPAIGVLMGALVLAQIPNAVQILGVALVVAAGIGAERIGHRDEGPAVFEPLAG